MIQIKKDGSQPAVPRKGADATADPAGYQDYVRGDAAPERGRSPRPGLVADVPAHRPYHPGLQPNQRILILGSVAGTRAGHGWFAPDEALDLFDALRLPRPGNTCAVWANSGPPALVRTRADGRWALTPVGERVLQLMGEIDPDALAGGRWSVLQVLSSWAPCTRPSRRRAGTGAMASRHRASPRAPSVRDQRVLHDPVRATRDGNSRIRSLRSSRVSARSRSTHGLTLHVASVRQARGRPVRQRGRSHVGVPSTVSACWRTGSVGQAG